MEFILALSQKTPLLNNYTVPRSASLSPSLTACSEIQLVKRSGMVISYPGPT